MNTGKPPDNHPDMLKCLPGADLLPESLDLAYLTPSLDEVKLKRSQLSVAGENDDDQSSVIADRSFPCSTIDDIFPPDSHRAKVSPPFAAYLSSKFVAESRDAYVDALRLGDTRGGMQALETGLGKLEKISRHDGGASSIAARIEILGSLERCGEARNLLDSLRAAVGRDSAEKADPSFKRNGSLRGHLPKRPHGERQDTLYETYYKHAHMMLDAATWSQDWELAAREAQRLQLDGAIFENYSLRGPNRRFERVRDLLNVGLQHEHGGGDAATDEVRLQQLGEALKVYSQGCEEMEIHHNYLEYPEARLTSHDHIDCSNLFFSATRICVSFHQNGHDILPADFPCIPALTEPDWARQALYFLERGKARALLRSIERYSEATVPEPSKLTLKDVAWEARRVLSRREHEGRSKLSPDPDTTGPSPLPESTIIERLRIRLAWRHTMLNAQSLATGRVSRWWKAGLDEMLRAVPDDTAIVEYGLVQGKSPGLLSFLITSAGVNPRWKSMRTKPILDDIAELKDLVESAHDIRIDQRGRRLEPRIFAIAKSLSSELVSQFAAELHDKRRLFIVPSGALAHVPWTLLLVHLDLPVPNPSLSIIPSLRIWYGLHILSQSKSKPAAGQQGSPAAATIICNSPRLADGSDRDIKFSRVEALYIARMHGTWPILADQTDRETFELRCQQSAIIHLSSHGTFDEESPMDSNMELFDDPLTPLDLSRLAITARFVVFSSCLSAYSRVFDSGTALSFAHALLGSGACAFVGTLWATGDVASLVYMVLFYRAMMTKGHSPSGALADAQATMRNLTEADKNEVVDDLLALFNNEAAKKNGLSTIESYVLNYKYWIDRQLRRYPVSDLRSPWSWAGFVLIGYGECQAYPPALIADAQ